jgi:hypothetical protein
VEDCCKKSSLVIESLFVVMTGRYYVLQLVNFKLEMLQNGNNEVLSY